MTYEEFLRELGQVPGHPVGGPCKDIRILCVDNQEPVSCCPITAVCRSKGLGRFKLCEWKDAASALGLPKPLASRIAAGADGQIGPVRSEMLTVLKLI